MRAGGTAVTAPHAGRAGSPFLGRAASAPAPLPPHGGAGAASPSSSPFLPSPPPSPPSPFPAARSQPGTRIAGSEAGGRHPSSLPLPPFAFFCPPTSSPAAMRRPTRRLALSVLGVLWIAALLLLFFGARRKSEAEGPESQTPEVRGHRALRGYPRPFRAAWKV